jgi:hypothetical protein
VQSTLDRVSVTYRTNHRSAARSYFASSLSA